MVVQFTAAVHSHKALSNRFNCMPNNVDSNKNDCTLIESYSTNLLPVN